MVRKQITMKLISLLYLSLIFSGCNTPNKDNQKDSEYKTWSSYLGDPGRSHYSTLSQITPVNVKNLKVAWSYEAPDWGQMQMNPIVVDSMLYGVSAALRAFALNAETGKEIWRFGDSLQVWHSTSRGVSYWENGEDKRILYTVGPNLYALNALTGKPISSFGEDGKIDLHSGMPESAKDKFVISNTPGTIYEDIIVMPLRLSEDAGAAPGNIMAFNVINGAVEWVFHTIPLPDEEGYETWEDKTAYKSEIVGAGNNWAGMAVDTKTGIIYVPTGSIAPDFYGGVREGSNLYANCLLALDAKTGKRIWHFQFTHHDIWDRDPPAPPNLLMIERNGKKVPAVAQVTKQGYVYVFDRKTGEPLFDIEEIAVPPSNLEGEKAWPTQPFPVKPKPFARLSTELTEDDVSPFAENPDSLRQILKNADKRMYAPPSLDPVLLLPGYDGAAEWGGTAADPEDGIIYVNANEMAWILQMQKNDSVATDMPLGERIYNQYCVTCHQADRKGIAASGYPSLLNLKITKTKDEVAQIITQGKGMMTGFPQLPKHEKEALIKFLFEESDKKEVSADAYPPTSRALPYKHGGYHKFLDENGLPAISPPWGTMHAIDLNTGDYIWSIPFGNSPELGEKGNGTGTENYGGAVVTENGLLFIGATRDGYFRAFDKSTGELLWEYKLPTAAFATPAMYEVNGKQYIAIACGGEKLGTEKGNRIVAFALE
jgi:quinoprotein glucose dehydrogenase